MGIKVQPISAAEKAPSFQPPSFARKLLNCASGCRKPNARVHALRKLKLLYQDENI
jgi:hypothetical protein